MKEILRLFKALEIKKTTITKLSSAQTTDLLRNTIERGFVFSPEIISNYGEDELFDMIETIEEELGLTPEKLNASFHKSWGKIKEASIEQLTIEQLVHYFTTYSFKALGIFGNDSIYIPNEKLEIPDIGEDIKLISIKGYTKKELKEKLLKMLQSGVAFKEDTIKDIVKIAIDLGMDEKEIASVKNKEAKAVLYETVVKYRWLWRNIDARVRERTKT